MTTELITIKFPTLTGAEEVSNILKTLQAQHFVEVRDAVVATKYDDQHVVVKQTIGNEPGPGTAVGALTGAAAGAVAGPAVGALAGAAAGTPAGPVGAAVGLVAGALIGRGVDASREPGWKEDDLKALATHELRSGESALLIYADTLWIDPIEQAASDYNAAFYRRAGAAQAGTVYVETMEIRTQTVVTTYKSWEETLEQQRADLEALRQRASTAVQTEQAAIREQIEKANAKIQQFYHNMLHTLNVWGEQIEANISQLESEIKQANAQAKAEIEQRLTAARESQAAVRAKVEATLSARLDDLKRDVESLRSQAATKRSEVQSKWNERIAQLDAKREAEEKRLAQLRKAQGAAWEEMNKSIRQSIDTYQETVRQAEAEFRKES